MSSPRARSRRPWKPLLRSRGPAGPLTPGQPASFRLGPVDNPTIFTGGYSYRLEVPDNASRATLILNSNDPGVDVDIYVRFGQDNDVQDGQVVTDYSSTGLFGNEQIVINRFSGPPLRAGIYFVSLALIDTGIIAEGALTATLQIDDCRLFPVSLRAASCSPLEPPS